MWRRLLLLAVNAFNQQSPLQLLRPLLRQLDPPALPAPPAHDRSFRARRARLGQLQPAPLPHLAHRHPRPQAGLGLAQALHPTSCRVPPCPAPLAAQRRSLPRLCRRLPLLQRRPRKLLLRLHRRGHPQGLGLGRRRLGQCQCRLQARPALALAVARLGLHGPLDPRDQAVHPLPVHLGLSLGRQYLHCVSARRLTPRAEL